MGTLHPITMDFKVLTMQFQHDGQQYKFQGIMTCSHEIVNSHQMEKLLKKGHSNIISQFHSIKAVETPSVHPDLQFVLSQHQSVFNTPHGVSNSRDARDHSTPLVSDNLPPNVHPYRHPFAQKNEIEKIV
jgi:hypothetical protein